MHEGEAPRISRHCLQLTVPPFAHIQSKSRKKCFRERKGGINRRQNGRNHIPFCSRPCRIALNRKTCAHRTVLIPFSAVLSVHSCPCAQTRTRKMVFMGVISTNTQAEAEIAIKNPETYHVSDGALSDLAHRTNRVLYSTGTDRRYCGPADEFPEPFPPNPACSASSKTSAAAANSTVSSIKSPLSGVKPVFAKP